MMMRENESLSLAVALASLDLEKTFAALIAIARLEVKGNSALFHLERILSENSHPDRCLNEAQVELLRLLLSARKSPIIKLLYKVTQESMAVIEK